MSGAVRKVKKAVKGAAKTVKKVAKSDIGQIALAVGTGYYLGPAGLGIGGAGAGGAALRAGLTSGIVGLASGRGINPRNILISSALAGGLANLQQARLANAGQTGADLGVGDVYDDFTTSTAGNTTLQSPVTQSPIIQTGGDASIAEQIALADKGPITSTGIRTDALTSDFPKPFDTLAKVPAESGIAQVVPYETMDASTGQITGRPLTPQQVSQVGGMEEVIQSPTTVASKPVGEFQGIKSIFQDQSLPLGDKIKLSAQNLIGVGGGDESLLQLRNDPSLGNLVNFAKSNPTAIIGSTSLMAALTAPKQPEETDFEYAERSALANELGNEYLESINSDLSGSDFNSISDWESFFTARIGRAFGGSTEIPMGKPRQNAGGIMELDYRDEGGFVPVGIKEKADDVPAMLSKNEFVFTANAVRNAGDGDVDKGAQKLYNQMKMLENGGTLA